MNTSYILFLVGDMYYMGTSLKLLFWNLPVVNGILGGLYFPYIYGIDSGIGTVLYWGKSVTSSGDGALLLDGGWKIWGGAIKGSFKCASP